MYYCTRSMRWYYIDLFKAFVLLIQYPLTPNKPTTFDLSENANTRRTQIPQSIISSNYKWPNNHIVYKSHFLRKRIETATTQNSVLNYLQPRTTVEMYCFDYLEKNPWFIAINIIAPLILTIIGFHGVWHQKFS